MCLIIKGSLKCVILYEFMMNLDKELLYRFFNNETTLEEEKKIRLWIDECDDHRHEFFRERVLFDAMLLHGEAIL